MRQNLKRGSLALSARRIRSAETFPVSRSGVSSKEFEKNRPVCLLVYTKGLEIVKEPGPMVPSILGTVFIDE
jgi:hypothetical protein